MSLLEHPIIACAHSGRPGPIGHLDFLRIFRPEIRVTTAIEKALPPANWGLGTCRKGHVGEQEPVRTLHIKDIRFMFSGHYGASIAPEAPPGRFPR